MHSKLRARVIFACVAMIVVTLACSSTNVPALTATPAITPTLTPAVTPSPTAIPPTVEPTVDPYYSELRDFWKPPTRSACERIIPDEPFPGFVEHRNCYTEKVLVTYQLWQDQSYVEKIVEEYSAAGVWEKNGLAGSYYLDKIEGQSVVVLTFDDKPMIIVCYSAVMSSKELYQWALNNVLRVKSSPTT